jgi:hypothetical protein
MKLLENPAFLSFIKNNINTALRGIIYKMPSELIDELLELKVTDHTVYKLFFNKNITEQQLLKIMHLDVNEYPISFSKRVCEIIATTKNDYIINEAKNGRFSKFVVFLMYNENISLEKKLSIYNYLLEKAIRNSHEIRRLYYSFYAGPQAIKLGFIQENEYKKSLHLIRFRYSDFNRHDYIVTSLFSRFGHSLPFIHLWKHSPDELFPYFIEHDITLPSSFFNFIHDSSIEAIARLINRKRKAFNILDRCNDKEAAKKILLAYIFKCRKLPSKKVLSRYEQEFKFSVKQAEQYLKNIQAAKKL